MLGFPPRTAGFMAVVVIVAACDVSELPTGAESVSHAAVQSSSFQRLMFSTSTIAGYSRSIEGEELGYHSPIPSVDKSLLVRSVDRKRSIAWESAPIPDDYTGENAVFVLMFGIDVNESARRYDLEIDGSSVISFSNPVSAAAGETIDWVGERGVSAQLHVTLVDRYGDAMGYLFITVPRDFWEPGRSIRFDVRGESAGVQTWFMVFKEQLENRVDFRNSPSLINSRSGALQTIRVEMLDLEGGRRFQMVSSIGGLDTTSVLGHNRFLLPVVAVDELTPVDVRLVLGEEEKLTSYEIAPVRRMEVYLLPHTHVDIGYTHHQDEVERLQWSHLEEALRIGKATEDFPDGARFVWNPESIWAVDSYVRNHPGEKTEALMEGIRKGWIELDGLFANLLTGIAGEEGLLRALDASRRLSAMSGVPIRSEMVSDIPGFTWGLVDVLAQNGIEYLSIGPNFGHRIGYFTEKLGDRPFYWESSSGSDRVLTWVSGAGYAWFHTGLGFEEIKTLLDEESVFRYLDQLSEQDYPYDLTYMRYNIGSDNGPPDPGLSEAVREWNDRFASPKLRISGTTELFEEFEDRYGDELPTLRGDMTGYWEDGVASSAKETALVRRTAEQLAQTERLAEQVGVALSRDDLDEAWRNVQLYYEHTWGSWNSISEPESELTLTSWKTKAGFALKAKELSDRLRDAVVESVPSPGKGYVKVFNTLDWDRSDVVVLPWETSLAGDLVRDDAGRVVPSQRLTTGELAFLASGIPSSGSKRFKIEQGRPVDDSFSNDERNRETAARSSYVVNTTTYRLEINPDTGSIRSLVHLATGRELVGSDDGGLNEYLYVRGRDPQGLERSVRPEVRWKERGSLVSMLEITARAPGTRSPLVTEIRLVEGLDWIEIVNRIDKAWVLEPEAVLFRFPFAIERPQVHIDVPFAVVRPELDQLPGASKNYYSLQRWVNLSGATGGGGVTITSIDAPMMQLGEIRTDAALTGWIEHAEPSSTFYSYVMNNYWETNYRAAQEGLVEFRYAIRAEENYDEVSSDRFGRARSVSLIVIDGNNSSKTY